MRNSVISNEGNTLTVIPSEADPEGRRSRGTRELDVLLLKKDASPRSLRSGREDKL